MSSLHILAFEKNCKVCQEPFKFYMSRSDGRDWTDMETAAWEKKVQYCEKHMVMDGLVLPLELIRTCEICGVPLSVCPHGGQPKP